MHCRWLYETHEYRGGGGGAWLWILVTVDGVERRMGKGCGQGGGVCKVQGGGQCREV